MLRLHPAVLLVLAFLVFGCNQWRRGPDGDSPDDDDSAGTAADDDDSDYDDDDDDDDDGDDDDTGPPDPGDLDSSEAVTGDWSCVGDDVALVPGESETLSGTVEDFQGGTPIAGAQVRIFRNNDPKTFKWDPDYETVTDSDGQFTLGPDGRITACHPFAARVWTEFEPPETYPTFQTNLVVSGQAPYTQLLRSVAYSTYQLLPLIVGIEPKPGRGIVVGRVLDCAGNPVANGEASIGHVDWESGEISDALEDSSYSIRYFQDGQPSHEQMQIGDDGRFMGLNVFTGEDTADYHSWSLLIWGIPQDESHCKTDNSGTIVWSEANEDFCLLVLARTRVLLDSVTLSDVKLDPVPEGCEG